LKFLEARLDNVVFRFGISPTRAGARQIVLHKHITVNGEVVNIPSYSVKPGDVVAVREKSKSLTAITESLAGRNARKFNWLEWDSKDLTGKFISYPSRDQIPENIQEQLIVELYSK
jgi:small subunit ribosomal protein S4